MHYRNSTLLGARFDAHHSHFYARLQSVHNNFSSLHFPASLVSGITIMAEAGAGSPVNSVYAAKFTTEADDGTPCKRCRKVLCKDELFFVQDSRRGDGQGHMVCKTCYNHYKTKGGSTKRLGTLNSPAAYHGPGNRIDIAF